MSEKAWICTVCGYVHHGPNPPEECPVCGAPADAFEEYVQPAGPVDEAQVTKYNCVNCNYVHQGSQPPDECVVCGAASDCFEPLIDTEKQTSGHDEVGTVIIIGGGVAGVSAAEAVRNESKTTQIIILSKENTLPYYRLNLTRYLAGEINKDDLPLRRQKWFDDNKIEFRYQAEVTKLHPNEKAVELRKGEKLSYDKLILTVGAHPFMPPFPGSYRQGVTNIRTITDADKILGSDLKGKKCVCIGGGLLGLETAAALTRQQAEVYLLEGYGWLLPRQLNQKAAEILAKHVEEASIKLITKAKTKEILGDERARAVQLEDGRIIEADLFIVATGIRTNSYLGRAAGLDVNRGIVVDNFLRTSNPDIFAAGDVTEHHGVVYGTWAPAKYQSGIAGMNVMGKEIEFGGIPRTNALKVMDVEMFSIGMIEPEDASYEVIESRQQENFFRYVFRDNHLVGTVLLGDAVLAAKVKKAIERKHDFSELLETGPTTVDIYDYINEYLA